MSPEESEKLLQEAERRLREKRELLVQLRRTEGLGEVVADLVDKVSPEDEKPPATKTGRRTPRQRRPGPD